MPKGKKRKKPKAEPKKKERTTPFNNPFAAVEGALKQKVRETKKRKKEEVEAKARPAPALQEAAEPRDPDQELFARWVKDTAPIQNDPRGVMKPALPPGNADHVPTFDEDAEVYAELVNLVEGRTKFDISDSDEFIEGCIEGLDRRVLQRLKRGEYAFRAHLDLHGMTREAARDAVERFITEKRREHHRSVLIVHGRGLNSKDNIPVLKGLLKSWLERGRIAKAVLAFCTARPHDGGAGAMYVLLRR